MSHSGLPHSPNGQYGAWVGNRGLEVQIEENRFITAFKFTKMMNTSPVVRICTRIDTQPGTDIGILSIVAFSNCRDEAQQCEQEHKLNSDSHGPLHLLKPLWKIWYVRRLRIDKSVGMRGWEWKMMGEKEGGKLK